MKMSKILGGLISVISILSLAAFALGMQSMFSVIQTGIPGGDSRIELDPTKPIIVSVTPTNTGLLDASYYVSMEFVLNGETVGSDSVELSIPASSQMPTELNIVIPPSALEVGDDPEFQVVTRIKVSSLFDYISFDNTLTIEGGAS